MKATFVGFQRYKKNDYSYCSCESNIFCSYEKFLLCFRGNIFLVIQRFNSCITSPLKKQTLLKNILPAQMCVWWCICAGAADRVSLKLRNEACSLQPLRIRKARGQAILFISWNGKRNRAKLSLFPFHLCNVHRKPNQFSLNYIAFSMSNLPAFFFVLHKISPKYTQNICKEKTHF